MRGVGLEHLADGAAIPRPLRGVAKFESVSDGGLEVGVEPPLADGVGSGEGLPHVLGSLGIFTLLDDLHGALSFVVWASR